MRLLPRRFRKAVRPRCRDEAAAAKIQGNGTAAMPWRGRCREDSGEAAARCLARTAGHRRFRGMARGRRPSRPLSRRFRGNRAYTVARVTKIQGKPKACRMWHAPACEGQTNWTCPTRRNPEAICREFTRCVWLVGDGHEWPGLVRRFRGNLLSCRCVEPARLRRLGASGAGHPAVWSGAAGRPGSAVTAWLRRFRGKAHQPRQSRVLTSRRCRGKPVVTTSCSPACYAHEDAGCRRRLKSVGANSREVRPTLHLPSLWLRPWPPRRAALGPVCPPPGADVPATLAEPPQA